MTNKLTNDNDYAVARELNDRALKMIRILSEELQLYDTDDPYDEIAKSVKTINRIYILVVNELEKIYEHNNSLEQLNEEPSTSAIWKRFKMIESNEFNIHDCIKNDDGFSHIALVNRLAIIAGKEAPEFTQGIQKIIDEADVVIETSVGRMNEAHSSHPSKYRGEYYIPKYKLTYIDNGSIIVNDVLVLKKTQNASAPRKLMEQAVKHPNELFKPELGKLTRNFSSVLSDMGITGTLKELFFPVANKDGVKFRPEVSRDVAEKDLIDTQELDKRLKKLGAETQYIFDDVISDEPLDEELKVLLAQHEGTRPLLEECEKERKDLQSERP